MTVVSIPSVFDLINNRSQKKDNPKAENHTCDGQKHGVLHQRRAGSGGHWETRVVKKLKFLCFKIFCIIQITFCKVQNRHVQGILLCYCQEAENW